MRPPLLYLGAFGVGLALHWLWPTRLLPGGAPPVVRWVMAAVLIGLGAGVVTAAMRQFRRAGTNVPTWQPTTALVTHGLYQVSRNPIYLGLSTIYAGLAVAANSLWVLGLLALVLVVIRYGVIAREERYLERKFGEAYRRYRAQVRRWL